MGGMCSRSLEEDHDDANVHTSTDMAERSQKTQDDAGSSKDMAAAKRHVEAHHANMLSKDPRAGIGAWHTVRDSSDTDRVFDKEEEYFASRERLLGLEQTLDFDYACRTEATDLERHVESIFRRLRRQDYEEVYRCADDRVDRLGQRHPRFAGDHFLSNTDLINETRLFKIAQQMPKGAHLHIHFNACLLPNVLLDIAKEMDRMFITSTKPLMNQEDLRDCEMQFSILSHGRENPGSLFHSNYEPGQTMRFRHFLDEFPEQFSGQSAIAWLQSKIVFEEYEAHNYLQTAVGAWEKFNGRTRMMKGLFNYETAYRKYTRLCLEDFLRDNIQYAEIRPNFMTSNQLYHDDGTGPIDNWGIMGIIIDEVEKFQAQAAKDGQFFGGLKVIYCTPRSFTPSAVEAALDECLEFKERWPKWIAGFDLVGEEARGRPIRDFVPELLRFRKKCDKAGIEIPFLFHCGETLDIGTDTDHNLIDALLLNSKRIGHGFALKHHPYIMEQMKARGVCVEICPISNEILGLTPRIGGHAVYPLLANNVHCTVNSDNGTIFRSTLSHDFYQILIGKETMGLYGWKQLILWSLEHACLDSEEYRALRKEWEKLWHRFLLGVVNAYGAEVDGPSQHALS